MTEVNVMRSQVYVHYDANGQITRMTEESIDVYLTRKAAGEQILPIHSWVDQKFYKIDLTTLTLIGKSDEELISVGLPPLSAFVPVMSDEPPPAP